MKKKLTLGEEKVFTYILSYLEDYNKAPSYPAIAEHFNYSPEWAAKMCQSLVAKKWLEFGPVIHSYREVKVLK